MSSMDMCVAAGQGGLEDVADTLAGLQLTCCPFLLPLLHCLQLVRYRCRKCRKVIATERNVIPQEGVGRRIFRRRQQPQQPPPAAAAAGDTEGGAAGGSMEQGAVFLEPISWMGDQVVGPVQGKLYCPNCSARLGSFNWSGESWWDHGVQAAGTTWGILFGSSSAQSADGIRPVLCFDYVSGWVLRLCEASVALQQGSRASVLPV